MVISSSSYDMYRDRPTYIEVNHEKRQDANNNDNIMKVLINK